MARKSILPSLFRPVYQLLSLLGLSSPLKITLASAPTTLTRLDSDGNKVSTSLADILANCPSLRGPEAYFTPSFWLSSGHLATIYCTFPVFHQKIPYIRKVIRVPDGGTLSLDFTPGDHSKDSEQPILVVCHGLTGGSHESYVVDILSRITKPVSEGGLGWRGCVVNFRGCAGTRVTSKQLYSGAYTDDLRCGLAYLSEFAPKAPLYGIGFSLGANVVAKYLGEEGEQTPLKAGLALGCPWNFYAGHVKLHRNWLSLNYSYAMATNLRTMVKRHYEYLKDDPRVDWEALFGNPKQTLYEFDSLVTRVFGGYPSTEAYYRDASAGKYAHNVSVPLLSLSAMDDPIVSGETIPIEAAATNPNLIFATTSHGGHLGWFEGLWKPQRWIGKPVLEFLRELERADPVMRAHQTVLVEKDGFKVVEGNERIGFKEEEQAEIVGGQEQDLGEGLIRGL
ncbi:alpha/beta hydrolase, carboxylesterase [Pseudohyphozyma bogoriensis]|nr:alpha/beta hydrolase, carboxylesterase [Pseudohyphozyma bogoriensis]